MRNNGGVKILLFLLAAFLLGYLAYGPFSPIPVPTATIPAAQKAPADSVAPAVAHFEAKVTRVIDGDTVVLDDGRHVRYLGINSPELRQRWGEAAKKLNAELVLDQTITLELDRKTQDEYGRTLAYVFVGKVMVNEKLLAEGLAKTYFLARQARLRYQERLLQAEARARQDHNGVWLDEWEKEIENKR